MTTHLHSASLYLAIPGISYKWNHTVFSRFIHVITCNLFYSFLWLDNIPLGEGITICFIYSSVDRHLGFFPIFLAIMNTVAINIPVQVFVVGIDFISLGPISRSGIAESYGNSMFNF